MGNKYMVVVCCVLCLYTLFGIYLPEELLQYNVGLKRSQNIPSRSNMWLQTANYNKSVASLDEENNATTPVTTCFRQIHVWSTRSSESLSKRDGEFSCPGLRCGVRIVWGHDYNLLQRSDALLLYFSIQWNWKKMIKHRPAGQKWIFYTAESPRHTFSWVIPPPQYNNMSYDYFMTFRTGLEAPLYGSYGRYDNTKPTVEANDARNWAENKTSVAAWVVSNCNQDYLSWKRTEFVQALAKHITVDIFGGCGTQKCEDVDTCGLQKYKFYLAFENSECEDYITAKFWRNGLTLGLIPVVYGTKKADYLKVAPPNSFIHVQDFKSLTDLMAYLQLLDANDNLYNEYFEWKKQGSVTYNMEFSHLEPENMCEIIVRRLLDDEVAAAEGKLKKARMPDWKTWWTDSCHPQGDFPIKME